MELSKIDIWERATIEKAFKVYGKDNQKIVAIEELSELQKEISKDLRGQGNSYNMAEEIADVLIMLQQIRMIYNLDEKIRLYISHKMERLEERLKEDASRKW